VPVRAFAAKVLTTTGASAEPVCELTYVTQAHDVQLETGAARLVDGFLPRRRAHRECDFLISQRREHRHGPCRGSRPEHQLLDTCCKLNAGPQTRAGKRPVAPDLPGCTLFAAPDRASTEVGA
jgi:hypothetical protein